MIATHKYEALYRLSPGLYDWGFYVQGRLANFAFQLRHCNLIVVRIGCKPECYKEYTRLIGEIGYPKASYITFRSGLYIYNLIRTGRPKTVMETGVLDGFSSRVMLEALAKNKNGRLVSVEIRSRVGRLVPARLKGRWDLVVGTPSGALPTALKRAGRVDIFMHDSNHSYDQMKREFGLAIKNMKKDGVILSDDVYVNNAFMEFSGLVGKKPRIIAGWSKCFGIIKLGN